METGPAPGRASQMYWENESTFDTSRLDTRRSRNSLSVLRESEAFWRLFRLYLFNFAPRVLLPGNYSSIATYTNFTHTYIYKSFI